MRLEYFASWGAQRGDLLLGDNPCGSVSKRGPLNVATFQRAAPSGWRAMGGLKRPNDFEGDSSHKNAATSSGALSKHGAPNVTTFHCGRQPMRLCIKTRSPKRGDLSAGSDLKVPDAIHAVQAEN